MKIVMLAPKDEFVPRLQKRLAELGEVVYVASRREMEEEALVKLAEGAEIIGPEPDVLGGFEKGKLRLTRLMERLPRLKAVCLSTTSYGWVDLEYCRRRGIVVSNIPGYSRESVAEHVLALILGMSKKIFVSDRRTREGRYQLEMGNEIMGKTLGVIGLGSIGSRVAELALAVGMKVVAYNRSPREQEGVEMVRLKSLLRQAEVISLNTTGRGNEGMIGREELKLVRRGVIVVNTASRELVDEEAMAQAVQQGKVGGYAYEAEDLVNTPLAKCENVVGIRGFGWYTKEALQKLAEIWVGNVEAMARGQRLNVVWPKTMGMRQGR